MIGVQSFLLASWKIALMNSISTVLRLVLSFKTIRYLKIARTNPCLSSMLVLRFFALFLKTIEDPPTVAIQYIGRRD
jgi:hypothetical protein